MSTATVTREDRWTRLAADLKAAGIDARLDRRPYSQIEYGRMVHGVSSSIIIRHPQGGLVQVDDKYGRAGRWYGWTVTREGRDGITIGRPTWGSTKRGEIVAAVQSKLGA